MIQGILIHKYDDQNYRAELLITKNSLYLPECYTQLKPLSNKHYYPSDKLEACIRWVYNWCNHLNMVEKQLPIFSNIDSIFKDYFIKDKNIPLIIQMEDSLSYICKLKNAYDPVTKQVSQDIKQLLKREYNYELNYLNVNIDSQSIRFKDKYLFIEKVASNKFNIFYGFIGEEEYLDTIGATNSISLSRQVYSLFTRN